MREYKCAASIDGICRNVIGNGTRCNGYSKECSLRPAYESIYRATERISNNLKNSFGIKGDM